MDIPLQPLSQDSYGVAIVDAKIATLIRQAQAGSDEAAKALFDRCKNPLLAVIRVVIQPRLRPLYDSDDFLNETFVQIYTTHFTEEILKSPVALWQYLKKIAENKVRDANRKYLQTQRFNLNRNVSLDSREAEHYEKNLWARDLLPEEALLLKELVEDRLLFLISRLPTLTRRIVRLLLRGATTAEIAHRLNVQPRQIYQAMDWLKKNIRE